MILVRAAEPRGVNRRGYNMYIDGNMTASFSSASAAVEQGLYQVDGGDPMQLDGVLSLCGRADGDADRFYTGLVAQLGLWNEPLTAEAIQELYNHIDQHMEVPAPCLAVSARSCVRAASAAAVVRERRGHALYVRSSG